MKITFKHDYVGEGCFGDHSIFNEYMEEYT